MRDLIGRMIFGYLTRIGAIAAFDLGGGGSSSPPPQDPAVGQAEQQLAGISAEQWAYYKNQYLPTAQADANKADAAQQQYGNYLTGTYIPEAQGIQSNIRDTAAQAQAADAQYAQQYAGYANTDRGTYDNTFTPTLGSLYNQSQTTGGIADQDYQAMLARGDVDNSFNAQRNAAVQAAQQAGVNGGSGRMLALGSQAGVAQAAAEANAMTLARNNAKQLGWTQKAAVAGLSSGLAGQATGELGQSNAANTSRINAATAPMTGLNLVGQGYQGAATAAGAPLQNQIAIAGGLNGGTQASTGAAQASGNLGIASTNSNITAWNDQNTQANANASGIGQFFGTAAGLAGAIYGGPMGYAAGKAAGAALTK